MLKTVSNGMSFAHFLKQNILEDISNIGEWNHTTAAFVFLRYTIPIYPLP